MSRNKKSAKVTPGESIVTTYFDASIEEVRHGDWQEAREFRHLARRIDAAIKRAVNKAVEAERSRAQTEGYFNVIRGTPHNRKRTKP